MQERNGKPTVHAERAVLVRVIRPEDALETEPLEELQGLAETAGARVVGHLIQRREAPDATTYLGSGKVAALHSLIGARGADLVLFDNDLSPAQARNLEKRLSVRVLDRTQLILDIFATHARTYEARLAVELAQLEYSLPRLKRMWTHLSRIRMGVGMRGPGEKQLEVDRRLVEKRITDLREELHVVEQRRARTVSSRRGYMSVSLVGYTNAGKSTLMNVLTGANVLAADKLFATLDTRTRRWQLPSWGPVLLSDTVGFIRDLPHHLIASFKATLEETRQADLLLHVADASNRAVDRQVAAVYRVLEELHIQEKDTLLVLNKVDRPEAIGQLEAIQRRYPHAIGVSAKTGMGLDILAQRVSRALSESFQDVDIEARVDNGKLLAYLAAHGEIISTQYGEERVTVHCRIPSKHLGRISDDGVRVVPHGKASNGAAVDGAATGSNGQPMPGSSAPAPWIEDVA